VIMPGRGPVADAGIPAVAQEITPDWLTHVLQASALGGARVTAACPTSIGTEEAFSGGRLYRVDLTLDRPVPGAPASLVAKLSPEDPALRSTMRPANARETAFYRNLAPGSGLPVPYCYHAAQDAASGASILLLQDLTAARRVPFTTGCTAADARRVIKALAIVHARWWNDPALPGAGGPAILLDVPFRVAWALYPARLRNILPGTDLPAAFLRLGDHIAAHEADIFARLTEAGPLTLLHRDPQADNVIFTEKDALLLDWQFCGKGRGVQDLAYFLISSLDPTLRRALETELVAHYHDLLIRAGVGDYTLADVWADYRIAVVGKLLLSVAATVFLDNTGPAKALWRAADLQRLLAFCDDHQVSDHMLRQA